jgi:PAS domain S-box-containing protein
MKKSAIINGKDESLERYREIFEEMEDIIIIINKKGVIEYVNRALRNRLAHQKTWYTGKNIADCLRTSSDKLSDSEFILKLFKKRHVDTRVLNERGDLLFFSWKTKPFTQSGQKKLMAIIRDVTREVQLKKKSEIYSKTLQETVHKRTKQLQREKQKAVDLHQAKAIFLSKMSHELRTPLTSIKGYAELLHEQDLPNDQREKFVSVIERNAQSLLDMVNETLDMIKVEQNKYQMKERSVRLSTLLRDLEDTFRVMAQEKNLVLDFTQAADLPEKIISDAQAIKQILTNLIGNALKFTQKGSISINVKMRTFPHKATQKLYFYVKDTGVGIPIEYHRRVFKSFEQYLDHHVVPTRGTGLGLAISRQMARLLGGNVKLVSSAPRKGSKFVFSLPVRGKLPDHD